MVSIALQDIEAQTRSKPSSGARKRISTRSRARSSEDIPNELPDQESEEPSNRSPATGLQSEPLIGGLVPSKKASRSPSREIPRLDALISHLSSLQGLRDFTSDSEFAGEPRQAYFICVRAAKGSIAIHVPCQRPFNWRKEVKEYSRYEGERIVGYSDRVPGEGAYEDDNVVWDRINNAVYEHHGRWKRWIPGHGIVSVREVISDLSHHDEKAGTYPVGDIEYVNIGKRKQDIHNTLSMTGWEESEVKKPLLYCNSNKHTDDCPESPNCLGWPYMCRTLMARQAKRQRYNLTRLDDLITCANYPHLANGLDTLRGMADESCIYNLSDIMDEKNEILRRVRSLEITLGWHFGRLPSWSPGDQKLALFSILGVWILMPIWVSKTGQLSDAWGFGQVFLASIALLIVYHRPTCEHTTQKK